MSAPRKVVLIAPFWGQAGHVGVYRVDRFVRWLAANGTQLVVVRAARRSFTVREQWGTVVAVRDPLGLYPDAEPGAAVAVSSRRPSPMRRALAHALFNPDPSVLWSRRAARDPAVLGASANADVVLSSSPPESAHIGAMLLASRVGAALAVDLRDGWLDDPNRSVLRHRWRQRLEGRLERRVLRQAAAVFVTSDVWRDQLVSRVGFTADRTTVLTNGYPPAELQPTIPAERPPGPPVLLHAGRVTSSRGAQRCGQLLAVLEQGLRSSSGGGVVRFVGALEGGELTEIQEWAPRLGAHGWGLEARPAVPRAELLASLQSASGLLLLATSAAAIPSKLFEYLPARRPILAATRPGSAVWRLTEGMPQVFRVDYTHPEAAEPEAARFINAALRGGTTAVVPEQFGEAALAAQFREVLGHLA